MIRKVNSMNKDWLESNLKFKTDLNKLIEENDAISVATWRRSKNMLNKLWPYWCKLSYEFLIQGLQLQVPPLVTIRSKYIFVIEWSSTQNIKHSNFNKYLRCEFDEKANVLEFSNNNNNVMQHNTDNWRICIKQDIDVANYPTQILEALKQFTTVIN